MTKCRREHSAGFLATLRMTGGEGLGMTRRSVTCLKKMLIVNAELVKKMDDNHGDIGRSELIDFLIDNQLKEESKNMIGLAGRNFTSFSKERKNYCAVSWSSLSATDWTWASSTMIKNFST